MFSLDFFRLNKKVALVTGGNTGIGRSLATAFAIAGADLFIYTYGRQDFEEMEKEIKALGRNIILEEGDLSNPAGCKEAVEKCIKSYGKIDILLNNAGSIHRAPILEGTDDAWKRVMDINLNAVYYLSREAAKSMVEAGSGKIINIASMLSFQGGKFVPSYTASKHGVAGLTKSFANELAEKNIQVNAIAPGYFKTANTAPIREDAKREAEILSRIPAGKWGEVSDLQGTAVFLASQAADYINGHVLAVDGGWLVR